MLMSCSDVKDIKLHYTTGNILQQTYTIIKQKT